MTKAQESLEKKITSKSDPAAKVRLEFVDDEAIAVVTLNDPKFGNPMSPEMGDAFSRAVGEIRSDANVKAVIVRGAGKDFSVGGHRDMLIRLGSGSMTEQELHDFMLGFYNRWLPMLDLEVPVISALQGDCIGVAPVFACAPDIAFADETLNLQVTFAGLALYPGMGLPWLIARKIGASRAALLTMSNLPVSGREAERLGLVERCVLAGQVFDEALRVARDIVKSGPATVRLLKNNLGQKRNELRAELERNALQQAKDFQTADYRARIAHYLPNHYDR
jgi:2-(1,2-epoxy-1,2-dihydrophenyl)acetyl-CoA isomerase